MGLRLARERQARALLARAAGYRLLAQAFGYPQPGTGASVRGDFARLGPPPAPGLGRLMARAHRAWKAADEEGLRAEYMRLFMGSGPVSLHETAYGDGRRMAGRETELADLNGFYHAFGFALGAHDPDLPDHLAVELEFLSLLLVKEAYARLRGLNPQARITHEATAAFLEQHLGRWVEALRGALAAAEALSPYHELAAWLEAALEQECRLRRVRPVPAAGRLPPDPMESEVFSCPRAAEAS